MLMRMARGQMPGGFMGGGPMTMPPGPGGMGGAFSGPFAAQLAQVMAGQGPGRMQPMMTSSPMAPLTSAGLAPNMGSLAALGPARAPMPFTGYSPTAQRDADELRRMMPYGTGLGV
jgi:hypothetical protein